MFRINYNKFSCRTNLLCTTDAKCSIPCRMITSMVGITCAFKQVAADVYNKKKDYLMYRDYTILLLNLQYKNNNNNNNKNSDNGNYYDLCTYILYTCHVNKNKYDWNFINTCCLVLICILNQNLLRILSKKGVQRLLTNTKKNN